MGHLRLPVLEDRHGQAAAGAAVRPLTARLLGEIARTLTIKRMTLKDFVLAYWPVIEPGRPFQDDPYIDVICEHLEAVTHGKISRLILNMPPRYAKSNLVTILWPAWNWALFPSWRLMFCSYSASLSTQHSVKRRRIIESEPYGKAYGNIVRLERDQNVKTEFENTRRGVMVATSTGGTVTGKGGDILIGDDVLNPELAESEAERKRALEFIDETWSSRLDDKRTGRMVFVEQRLHAKDVTAHLMKQRGVWTQLIMPAIFDKDTDYVLPMSGRTVSFKAGDLLSSRDTPATLEQTKLQMGSRGFQAQFLQSPSQEEGAIIKRGWFKTYANGTLPKMDFTAWSWDTAAKDGQHNDYSVGQLWGLAQGCFYLLDMVRLRMNYPGLKREVRERWIARRSDVVLVEDTSVGQALVPDLKAERVPVIPVLVDRDKIVRLNVQSPVIEAGMVYLPDASAAPWVVQFRDEVCDFPYSDHDDIVDSAVQALHYLRTKNSIPAWRPL